MEGILKWLLGIRGDINLREGELSIRWLYLPEHLKNP
jgi:hypothetical protein